MVLIRVVGVKITFFIFTIESQGYTGSVPLFTLWRRILREQGGGGTCRIKFIRMTTTSPYVPDGLGRPSDQPETGSFKRERERYW